MVVRLSTNIGFIYIIHTVIFIISILIVIEDNLLLELRHIHVKKKVQIAGKYDTLCFFLAAVP